MFPADFRCAVEVFLSDALQYLSFRLLGQIQQRSQCPNDSHMGKIHHVILIDQCQTSHRQKNHLAHIVGSDVPDAFDAGLGDFPEIPIFSGKPIDLIIVAEFLHLSRQGFRHLGDGQCHVRLQRHQLSPRVRKGENSILAQKILILRVQLVLFEFSGLKAPISVVPEKLPKPVHRLLVIPQNSVGINHPLPLAFPIPLCIRRVRTSSICSPARWSPNCFPFPC